MKNQIRKEKKSLSKNRILFNSFVFMRFFLVEILYLKSYF